MTDSLRKLYVELTTACNLDCQMCPRSTYEKLGDTMSRDSFGLLVQQLKLLPGVRTICLSGFGEPMVHPDLYTCIEIVKRAGLRAELITNGLLLDGNAAARLVDTGLDKLSVSMDSAGLDMGAPFHSRGVSQVQDNLRALYQLKRARRVEGPEIALVFVASRRNIGQLPALRELARDYGATQILVSNLIASSPEMGRDVLYQNWGTTRRSAPVAAWNPVIDLPRMDVHAEADSAIARLRNSGAHLRTGSADICGGRMHCRFVHEGMIAITASGDVAPCLPLMHTHRYYFRDEQRKILAFHAGNIYQRPLIEIWNAPEFREFRERVRRFEFSPCLDCSPCEFRETNEEDCYGDQAPRCGECLWAAGLVQCP